MGLSILLSARSCCRLSWERWLRPLHLIGRVLLGCCRLRLTSLSSIIVLQPPLLCEGWSGRPLCVSGDGSVLSEQYSVHRSSISGSSVRQFSERSWAVVVLPCFTVVNSFTSWYALLLLFFLKISSISLHFSPIHVFPPFSCTSWCCSPPCISQIL